PGLCALNDLFGLGKIGSALVLRWDQVTGVHQNSVRRHVMNVTAVIVRSGTYETSGERIDPGARTDAGLAAIQTGPICIGAAGAEMAASYTVASKPAGV